jgi:putative transposase
MNTKTILEVFMENDIKQLRILAVQRFKAGESPESICASLGKSKFWLYKWVKRYNEDPSWCEDRSCRPFAKPTRTPSEIEEIVKMVRLNLYNQDLFCGAQAILWEMEDLGARPLPSIRTINRILARNELTHRRTGKYKAKGTTYPVLPSTMPNQTHQADVVGPCYLKGTSTVLQSEYRRYRHSQVWLASFSFQIRSGNHKRFLGCMETNGNTGTYPG